MQYSSKIGSMIASLFEKNDKFKQNHEIRPIRNQLFKSRQWMKNETAQKYAYNVKNARYDNLLLELYCDIISSFCPDGCDILDASAGTGALSIALSKRGFSVTAFDISEEMLRHVQKADPQIKLKCGDLFEENDQEKKYDAVVSRWVVPHFSEWKILIRNWSNIVKPGGFLIFDMTNKEHIELFDETSLKELGKFIGYDHSKSSNDEGFYACGSNEELSEVARNWSFKFVSRKPHGILKCNLKLASIVGGAGFREITNRLNTFDVGCNSYDLIKRIEVAASEKLNQHDFHGSIIIFQKLASSQE